MLRTVVILALASHASSALQTWGEQPTYQEVNPGGDVRLSCVINDMKGQCSWEKDGRPVGIFPGKYEWADDPKSGDCSLTVKDANLEYDDAVWQCQVTPSSFQARDALISEQLPQPPHNALHYNIFLAVLLYSLNHAIEQLLIFLRLSPIQTC